MLSLPKEVHDLARRWNFLPTEELPGGHCSRVFADDRFVLKYPLQGEEATSGWKMALQHSGTIGPQVHQHDDASGALLMQRMVPGTKLSDAGAPEGECMRLALRFAAQIRAGSTDGLMPLAQYFEQPTALVKDLLATTKGVVALHGDLHHENILLGPDGWVVIDPKGLVGDPAFEFAAFMRNPINELAAHTNLRDHLQARIVRISQLTNADPWRIWGWSVAAFDGEPPEDDPWFLIREALEAIEPGRR